MREIRTSGSEGGGTELNRSFLPLSLNRSAVEHAGIDFEVFCQAADVVSCQLAFAVQHVGKR